MMLGRAAKAVRPSFFLGMVPAKPREEYFMANEPKASRGWSWWYLLFLVQFVVILWPPFYNRIDPTLAGIPFFYWFQLFWVLVSAALTAIVYFATAD